METMKIGRRDFSVLEYVTDEEMGDVPAIGLPIMSDYKFQRIALEDRLQYPEVYREVLGEDVELAIAGLRRWLEDHSKEADR